MVDSGEPPLPSPATKSAGAARASFAAAPASERARGRRRRAFVVAAVLLGTLAPALALEAYIRLTKRHYTPATLRERTLHYVPAVGPRHVLAVDQPYELQGVALGRINSRGCRGEDFPARKPEGEIRIVFMGGSMVFDQLAVEGEDWPRRVGDLLRARGHENVRTINAGVPGHSSWDALARLAGEVHEWSPDVVVLCEAWNDLKVVPRVSPERPFARSIQPYGSVTDPRLRYSGPIDRLLCESSQLYVRLRHKYWDYRLDLGPEGARPPAAKGGSGDDAARDETPERPDRWTPGMRQFGLNLRLFADCAREIGAIPVFVTQPTLAHSESPPEDRARIEYDYVGLDHEGLVAALDSIREAVLEAGRARQVAVVDAFPVLRGQSDSFDDHVHLNRTGSAAIAEVVAEALDSTLRGADQDSR